MLSKQYRLRKNKEFNFVYKHGKSVGSKLITFFYVKTTWKPNKFGFSISNKLGNSVVRHKLKRRLTEIVRPYIARLNPRYNYVFIARKGLEELSFLELKQKVENILLKSDMLDNV